MFNRSGSEHNRVKFNAGSGSGGVSANVSLRLAAEIRPSRVRPAAAVSGLNLQVACKATRIGSARAVAGLVLGMSGGSVKITPAAAKSALNLGTQITYYAYGTEEISFDGLVLRSGDVLVIDTDLMTVTLNGVNVARYVNTNSRFVKLLAGDNTLVWQDKSGATRQADVRVEWKPRWL